MSIFRFSGRILGFLVMLKFLNFKFRTLRRSIQTRYSQSQSSERKNLNFCWFFQNLELLESSLYVLGSLNLFYRIWKHWNEASRNFELRLLMMLKTEKKISVCFHNFSDFCGFKDFSTDGNMKSVFSLCRTWVGFVNIQSLCLLPWTISWNSVLVFRIRVLGVSEVKKFENSSFTLDSKLRQIRS